MYIYNWLTVEDRTSNQYKNDYLCEFDKHSAKVLCGRRLESFTTYSPNVGWSDHTIRDIIISHHAECHDQVWTKLHLFSTLNETNEMKTILNSDKEGGGWYAILQGCPYFSWTKEKGAILKI